MLSVRYRLLCLVLAGLTIVLGLWSRSSGAAQFSPVVAEYAGDTLWALTLFLVLGTVAAQRLSPLQRALLTLALSYAVECSQLYHAFWIDELRNTRIGALLLGHSFLWSDLLCYTCGTAIGLGGELALRRMSYHCRLKRDGSSLPE